MQQLSDKIYFIPGRHRAVYPFCNSIYIDDEIRAVIDPSSDRKVLAEIKNVQLAILSHFHSDHAREIRALPSAKIAIHDSEADVFSDLKKLVGLIFFEDESRAAVESWLADTERIMKIDGWQRPVAMRLQDGDEINLGKTKIKVIHTPGHTIGHCCFWFAEPEILFSADIDLSDFGPWYGNACSDLSSLDNSLEKLKAYKPRLVVTGHDMGLVPGEDFSARLDRFRAVIITRENKLLDALSSPKTLDEIVDLGIIYGEFLARSPAALRPIEKRMIRHHLRWLEQKGRARVESDYWRLVTP